MRVGREIGELGPGPRAVALGTFDGVHLGHRKVVEALLAAGPAPTVVTFDPHPRTALGNRVELLTTLDRRLELLEELGVEATLVVEFTLDVASLEPAEFAEPGAPPDRRGDGRSGGGLPLRTRPPRTTSTTTRALGFETKPVPILVRVSSTFIRELVREGDVAERRAAPRPAGRGRGHGRHRRRARRNARLPDREPRRPPRAARARERHLRRRGPRPPRRRLDRHEPALRRQRTARRGVPARLLGRPLRQAARRRALEPPPRRARLRQRGRARRPDRPDVELTRSAAAV